MNIAKIAISRHVLAFMLSAVIILFGLVGYNELGVDRNPNVEFPIISVTTKLAGANPDIIDSSITNVLESKLNGVPGIDSIASSSSPGVSVITVRFILDKDIDVAFNELQTKINQVMAELPDDTDTPVLAKVETGAQPIMWLVLQGDRTTQQLNLYATNTLKKRLENIDGIGEIRIGGKRDRVIRVNLNTQHMAALSVTSQDIIRAFRTEHLQLPGGFLAGQNTEDLIKLDLEYHSPEALERLIVSYRDGAPIFLRDIAEISDSLADYRQVARFNGTPSVGLGIIKISGANVVAIVDSVKEVLDAELRPNLPAGLEISIGSNDATFIEEMIAVLTDHLIMGVCFAALVVFIFLKDIRSTLIISAAIPVSLLGAMIVMFAQGYTLNTMTMLSLLLLIGVVVDDAIVVLENIFRHREENPDLDPALAAEQGTNEVAFAVIASTLTLVCIFAPVVFMKGIIGRFFEAFALVVTFGVIASLFVSLTLTPMLCSRFLKVEKRHGKLYNTIDAFFVGMEKGYHRLLTACLNFRWTVVFLTILIVFSTKFFISGVGSEFMPEQDEGAFLVLMKTPLGSSIEYSNSRLKLIEEKLAEQPAIQSSFAAFGSGRLGQVNSGASYIRLAPRDERTLSQTDVMEWLKVELGKIPGVRAFPSRISAIGGRGEPLQFVVRGPNLQTVAELAQSFHAKLAKHNKELGNIDMALDINLPQVKLKINRERAANLGLSASDVAMAVNIVAGGFNVAKYNDEPGDGERYNIRLKADEGTIESVDDLRKIYLRSAHGDMVRLDTVVNLDETVGPAIISKYNLQYAAQFYSNPTISLGAAVALVMEQAKGTMPPGYEVKMIGQAEEFGKTMKYIVFLLVMAIILVYMVLASQFNSFVQPIIVMIAQPLAIIGGIFGLWLMGHTLNIFSMIGLILLMGLVAKNSILLVDLTNQLRDKSQMAINEALLKACPIRLRPVLMTSLTIVLAMLPGAMGIGPGKETNGPLSVAIIGGMISSTLLTLVVIPSVYSLVEGGLARVGLGNVRNANTHPNKELEASAD